MNNELICTPVMLRATPKNKSDYMMFGKAQHLYLVSEEEIKEGDWMMMKDDHPKGRLRKCWEIYPAFAEYGDDREQLMIDDPKDPKRGFGFLRRSETYKVIATTDKSLSLPLIPNSFIEEWVAKQGKIDRVKIKLHRVDIRERSNNVPHFVYLPETNNLQIIILPIEDKTYSREEVYRILDRYRVQVAYESTSFPAFKKWFDLNY